MLTIDTAQEVSAQVPVPNLNVNEATTGGGGAILERCSDVVLTALSDPQFNEHITWAIDGVSFPNGVSVTIPAELEPGIHALEFVVPRSLVLKPDGSFSQVGRGNFAFTIVGPVDPSLSCTAGPVQENIVIVIDDPVPPVASDHTIEVLQGSSGLLTIPFKDLVTLPPDHTFEQLTITFGPLSAAIIGASPTYAGTTSDTPDGTTNPLTVDADAVVITSSLTTNDNVIIPYTITDRDGLADNGVITFRFIDYIGTLMANPYTLDPPLLNLFGLPTLEIPIQQSVIRSSLLTGTQLASSVPASEITIAVTSPGSATGTIVVAPASGSDGLTLSYTPKIFETTETFDYTITFRGETVTSQLSIVVPALVCNTAMVSGINFGDVDVDETSRESSIDIVQEGNADVQVMMKGTDWMSGGTAAMNADVTKYSTTASEAYGSKTALTKTSENVGGELGDSGSVSVYVQLLVDLIDDSFRGMASQVFTISNDCST